MKKLFLITIIILTAAMRLSAEKTADVSLRYSKQDTTVRIVLEAGEDLIKNSKISLSLAAIKVDFPLAFEIIKPKDFFYETAKKDRSFYIFLKDVTDVKSYRLAGPPRLVFDLTLVAKAQKEAAPRPDQKTVQSTGPLVSPGPPAPQPPQAGQKQQPAPSTGPLVSPGPPALQPPQAGQKQQPAPSPAQPAEKTHKRKVIVLDPGHGGYDYGIISQDAREKDVNLALSKDLSAAMAKKGLTVFLDRKVDQSVSLSERIHFSNAKNPDIFISIHAASWNGFAIYVSSAEDVNSDAAVRLYSLSSRQIKYLAGSKEAARVIADSLKKEFNVEVVMRELSLPVLNSLNAPAIMIEYPSLKSYASDQKMRERFVGSIMKGIAVYEQ
jgi:N-acetylmuramoyl-L-alanine amidase